MWDLILSKLVQQMPCIVRAGAHLHVGVTIWTFGPSQLCQIYDQRKNLETHLLVIETKTFAFSNIRAVDWFRVLFYEWIDKGGGDPFCYYRPNKWGWPT